MLKTIDEIKDVEVQAGVVINGIDNPNVMSIDSTEPEPTKADEVEEPDKYVSEVTLDTVKAKKKEVVEEEEEEVKVKPKVKVEAKPETEIETETKDDPPQESKKVVKRIGDLTKKWRTAERERDFEKEKRLEVEAKLKELSSKVQVDEDKPQKEDFDDEDDYLEALTDWKIETRLKASQESVVKEIADKDEKQAVSKTYDGLDDAMDKGKEKYEDFNELILDEDLVISTELTQILLDTEIPEDIMYYLASNPDESARISDLDPVRIAKEVGKLEVRLTKEEKQAKEEEEEVKPKPSTRKKQSAAPEPITPVKTTGATEKDPNKMSPREYKAWREQSSR